MSEVVRLHTASSAALCSYCDAVHNEIGVLCAKCRKEAEPAAAAFVQATAASVIRDLRLWKQQGFPLSGPIGRALQNAQKLYDATEPRITVPRQSYVHREDGQCWAYPAGSSDVLGPFPTEDAAYAALTAFAAPPPFEITEMTEIIDPSHDDEEYDGFLRRTLAEAEVVAAAKGCVIRLPKTNELFLDIDSEAAAAESRRLIKVMYAHDQITADTWTPSPSGKPGRWHVVVVFHREVRDEYERVMLQAVLGSDPMRELLSWRRLGLGVGADAVSLFFERAT